MGLSPETVKRYIMNEVGFNGTPDQYNGKKGMYDYRLLAAQNLREEIYIAAKDNMGIAPPDERLTDLLVYIARNLDGDYRYEDEEGTKHHLTNTWKAASDIIQIHIDAFAEKDLNERQKIFDKGYNKCVRDHYASAVVIEVINNSMIAKLTRDSEGDVIVDYGKDPEGAKCVSEYFRDGDKLEEEISRAFSEKHLIARPNEGFLRRVKKEISQLYDMEDRAYVASRAVLAHIMARSRKNPGYKHWVFEDTIMKIYDYCDECHACKCEDVAEEHIIS